jgi:RluA family pseudouridine synthase
MLQVLWEDERLIAVAKPAGLATAPGRDTTESVLDYVKPGGRKCLLIHRLDKETSGVLLLAKDREAQRCVCRQFLNRTVRKEYLALVAGSPDAEQGVIDQPLGRHRRDKKRMACAADGRPARTRWQVERRLGPLTLLRCFPETGRTHQIRVHLQSIGLPLAVDNLYHPPGEGLFLSRFKSGYKHKAEPERPLIARLTLHAERLEFMDCAGRPVSVTSPMPKDLAATVKQMGKLTRDRE